MIELEGTQQSISKIEELRLILETKQGRPISYDEALEVGESLVSYFKILAEEPQDTEEK